ncbi:CbtA family protein [Actinocorallia libanotica]|uniref:CbtA family protein n=1 Tax=Actinocorallia libanotica TaxID=46162 RepID=A0ABN1Q4W1_9ACTN
MSPRAFLINGLIAGLIAGLFAFGAAYFIGEPHIDTAIALEEGGSHSHGDDHSHGDGRAHAEEAAPAEEEEGGISRDRQSTFGLATGTVVIGLALGGIVGVAAAFALGRLGRLRPAASTALIAGVGFVAFALAAWVKYPPNPPAVGSGDTIGARTAAYFGFQGLSVLLAVAAVVLAARLASRGDGWLATAVPVVGWAVLITAAGLALPAADPVPAEFPAEPLWGFRLSSLVTQAVLWGVLALVLSGLVHRTARAEEARRSLAAGVRA